jgi:hypothetical protein
VRAGANIKLHGHAKFSTVGRAWFDLASRLGYAATPVVVYGKGPLHALTRRESRRRFADVERNSARQLNGKVGRAHRSDEEEFYQLLSYKDDVDLEAKIDEWEHFHNLDRRRARSVDKHLTKRSGRIY